MFVASIMQSLQIEPGEEGLPDIENPILGLVMCVKPFMFIPRKQRVAF